MHVSLLSDRTHQFDCIELLQGNASYLGKMRLVKEIVEKRDKSAGQSEIKTMLAEFPATACHVRTSQPWASLLAVEP